MAPAFHDMLSGISPETGYPDNFAEIATGAYDEDFSASNAKIAALSEENAALAAELQLQKVINYDLMAAGATAAPTETDPEAPAEDEDNPEDVEIDDLFKPKSKED